jgi:hypothetical protein
MMVVSSFMGLPLDLFVIADALPVRLGGDLVRALTEAQESLTILFITPDCRENN